MQFYNTITQKKEIFIPKEPGKISIYVCGITAYDLCHIGHARAAVVFDVLVRFLRFLGYEVNFVRNFTDIDDKIITRAHKERLNPDEVANKYIEAFYDDMKELNVLKADFEPRATDHIQDMQELIQRLLEQGYAYKTPGGDVYFKVRSFPKYGELSGRNIEELKSGARIEPGEEKKDPLDFALWKHAKSGEPSWPSPWGPGRPGWHIECSVMSEKYLGLPLDIHGGGQDLIFPHHENERAQTMAANNQELARYWLHNGFIRVKREKMSKSLGNFVTIRDIYPFYLPEVLRFFLLSKHYRSPLDFDWTMLEESEKGLKRLYLSKLQIKEALNRSKWSNLQFPKEITERLDSIIDSCLESLKDDLNTAAALGHTFSLIRLSNWVLEDKKLCKSAQTKEFLIRILNELEKLGNILGILSQDSQEFLTKLRAIKAQRKDINIQEVERLITERQNERKNKNFKRADAIREKLAKMGVEVQDTPKGPIWDIE